MTFLESVRQDRAEYAMTLASFEGGAYIRRAGRDVTQQEIELQRRIIADLDEVIALEERRDAV